MAQKVAENRKSAKNTKKGQKMIQKTQKETFWIIF